MHRFGDSEVDFDRAELRRAGHAWISPQSSSRCCAVSCGTPGVCCPGSRSSTTFKQYDTIVAKYKDDRAVAATALIRMAECYRKQGDAESRKIYERVVRDFADQKEALSVARAQLGHDESAQRAGAMSSRQVWTLPLYRSHIDATVSHDGRYIPYTDWAVPRGNGELFLHDVATGADRQITNEVQEYIQEYAWEVTFSPDDTRLAYAWFNKDHFELRIIGLQTPGASPPRVLFSNSEVPRIFPQDWSVDGKWLAVQLTRKDKTTADRSGSGQRRFTTGLEVSRLRAVPRSCFSHRIASISPTIFRLRTRKIGAMFLSW